MGAVEADALEDEAAGAVAVLVDRREIGVDANEARERIAQAEDVVFAFAVEVARVYM